jgi:predicted TIM-barrel enzyme
MDMLTTPYVFDAEQAVNMTAAGADILVAHMGLTTAGSIGARTARKLDACVGAIDGIVAAARGARQDVIVLCHGGPIAEPDDAAFILKRCRDVDGFYGASSMERLPTERAIREQTARFVQIRK